MRIYRFLVHGLCFGIVTQMQHIKFRNVRENINKQKLQDTMELRARNKIKTIRLELLRWFSSQASLSQRHTHSHKKPDIQSFKKWKAIAHSKKGSSGSTINRPSTHSLTYPITYSPTHSSPTHSLTPSLTHLNQPPIHSPAHSITHSFMLSLAHWIARSASHILAHSLAPSPTHGFTNPFSVYLNNSPKNSATLAGSHSLTYSPFQARAHQTFALLLNEPSSRPSTHSISCLLTHVFTYSHTYTP